MTKLPCGNPFCPNKFKQNKWGRKDYCCYDCGFSYRRHRIRMAKLGPKGKEFELRRYTRWMNAHPFKTTPRRKEEVIGEELVGSCWIPT